MKLETFFEKFDKFADAPDAVPRMRELVLELAVQGELVEQKPAEGDGHALLRQIHKKNPPSVTETDLEPVDSELASFPSSWAPSKLGEVAEIIRGVTFPGSAKSETPSNGDVACLRTASVQAEIDWDDLIYISPTHVSREDQWVIPNDIMISMANSYALVGKVAIVREVPQKATFGAFLAAIRPVLIEPYFLLYVLRSPRMQAAFRASSSQTTNIANISLGRMRPLPFPLPPLAEQKRIVAKVDELMTLCDQLEEQQQKREEQASKLARASLARFADAPTPANLDFLFHSSFIIPPSSLRKSILTLAVQGKLVPQDPNDEPAEELLNRIFLRPTKGKVKSRGELENPFEVPATWRWVELRDLVESMSNGIYKPSKFYSETGTACVRMFNIQDGRLDLAKLKRLDLTPSEIDQYRLEVGDLLVNRVNSRELVGKCAVVEASPEPLVFEAMNIRVRLLERQHLPNYVNLVLRSDRIRELFQNSSKQAVGQASINQPQVAGVAIPIPPLIEQRRIVAKVEQLMALVDELETMLADSRATAANLLTALVAELTGTPHNGKVSIPPPPAPDAAADHPNIKQGHTLCRSTK